MKGFNKSQESIIIRKMKDLLLQSNTDEMDEIIEFAQLLKQAGVELISVAPDHSVGLYFYCLTYIGLANLYELLTSSNMEGVIETAFNKMVNGDVKIHVIIEWNVEDYNTCMDYFNSSKYIYIYIYTYIYIY